MVRPELIALDLDETLLDRNSALTPANRAALEAAIAAGVQIVVATGRAYHTVPEEIRRFPGIRYAITGNGAAIYDMETGETVARRVLAPETAEQVLAQMAELDVSYEIFVEGAAYAQGDYLQNLDNYMMDDHRQAYVLATRTPVADIREFMLAHRRELDSIAVIPRDLAARQAAMERLAALPEVYVTTSNIRLIEVNHWSCTKAAGLQYLAERLGVPREKTAAFGNGDNDAEMLRWAGCGVSVAEGTEACRAAADYVTGSYEADGVAEAFRVLFGL